MKNDHVISGLMEKHKELNKQLDHHNGQVLKYGAAIASVEATIRLYNPEFITNIHTVVRRSRDSRGNRYFKAGEATALILDYLRENKGPQPTTAIVRDIGSLKGVSRETLEEAQWRSFYSSLSKSVLRLSDAGRVRESHRERGVAFWEIAG